VIYIFTPRHEVQIDCEHCGWSWVEDVTVQGDEMILESNPEWKCVECGGAFCFDDFAGEVRRC
jgi:hypothetical protein